MLVVLNSLECEDENIWRILDPTLVDTDLGGTCLVVGDFLATSLLPVIHKVSLIDVKHNGPHLLHMLAHNLLLVSIFVQQFGHCDVGPEKVLLYRVLICI